LKAEIEGYRRERDEIMRLEEEHLLNVAETRRKMG
jgi:hypothetical protein